MKQITVGIVGGRLQGVEACYLARKAGYQSILFDKDPLCAAADLADVFVCADLLATDVSEDLAACDFILPAMENLAVMEQVAMRAQQLGIPYLYDRAAYHISASKRRSNRFFRVHQIPYPRSYPQAKFPVVLKPSGLSGSAGVQKIRNPAQLQNVMRGKNWDNYVIQEFLEGPSYSIEVVGDGKTWTPLAVTQILTDGRYDCCRVVAGAHLPPAVQQQMRALGTKIGAALHIRGIFDVETIYANGEMHVLEIDARLPSQTPTAVWHATGINMLSLLWEMLCGKPVANASSQENFVIYQHIAVCGTQVKILGEHIMAQAGRLQYAEDFFGCPEALTNYRAGRQEWVATLIARDGESLQNAERKIERAVQRIQNHMKDSRDETAVYQPPYKRVV